MRDDDTIGRHISTPRQEGHALRRDPPRHLHHRGRARERRFLRARARVEDGQEDRQPGRPDRLPPLLRRRRRQRRGGHHLLRVPRCAPRTGRRRHGAHRGVSRRHRAPRSPSGRTGLQPRACRRPSRTGACGSPTRRASGSSSQSTRPRTGRSSRTIPRSLQEHALQGFDSVRAFAGDPERSRALLEDVLGFEPPRRRRLGGARRRPWRAVSPTTRHPLRAPGSPAPGRSITWPGRRR